MLKIACNGSSAWDIKELQSLFEEFGTEGFVLKLEVFKTRIVNVVETGNAEIEEDIGMNAERFGKVYGAVCVTGEIFYIFCLCFKRIRQYTKALEYGHKAVFWVEKIGILDENVCRYWINLASVYALVSDHKKSLQILERSKKMLKSLIMGQEREEKLMSLLGICRFNIAAELENLKNYEESEKQYLKTLQFYEFFLQFYYEKMRSKVMDCVKRIQYLNNSKGSSYKSGHTKNNSYCGTYGCDSNKSSTKTRQSQRIKSGIPKFPTKSTLRGSSDSRKKPKTDQNKYKSIKKIPTYTKNNYFFEPLSKILKIPPKHLKTSETKSKNISGSTKAASFHNELNYSKCLNLSFCFNSNPDMLIQPLKSNDIEIRPKDSKGHDSYYLNNEDMNEESTEKIEDISCIDDLGSANEIIFDSNEPKFVREASTREENQQIIENKESLKEKSKPCCDKPECLNEKNENITDKQGLLRENSELDGDKQELFCLINEHSRYTEENIEVSDKESSNKVICSIKNKCIYKSDIEFELKPFKSVYKLQNSLNRLQITCKNTTVKYKLILNLPKNVSIFDYILEKIHPCLTIIDNGLILVDQELQLLTTGNLNKVGYVGNIKISRVYPRWKILVEGENCFSYFELDKIFRNFDEFPKDPSILLSFFNIKHQTILIEQPLNYPPAILCEKFCRFEKLEADIKIYELKYLESYSLLIQGKSGDNALVPFILDKDILVNRSKNSGLSLGKILIYLEKSLRLNENSELFIETSNKFLISLSPTRESLKVLAENSDSNIDDSDLPMISVQRADSNLSQNSKLPPELSLKSDSCSVFSELPNYSNLFISGKSLEYEDYDDRIILRFSIYQNSQIYQVYMKISEPNVLSFIIESGLEKGKRKKFSIEVQTLCDRIGFEKKYILPLGSFILRNLLVIKSHDICYFDFSKPIKSPTSAIEKIAGLLKGYVSRKKFKLKFGNLIGKKKIRLSGHVYTALVYKCKEALYLRFVSGIKVLGLDLNFTAILKDKYFLSIDQFFSSFSDLGVRILKDPEILTINPEYLLS